MFGYITVNHEELKVREDKLYHSYYCGLCHALKERNGRAGQMTLTYDMTFLVILLNSLYENEMDFEKTRCITHPIHKYEKRYNKWSDYAADMNVLLAYHNLLDDWKDDKKKSGYVAAKLLEKQCRRIENEYPRQSAAVKKYMEDLAECEAQNTEGIEKAAHLTGKMLAEIFVCEEDNWSNDLRQMGYFLGKFIYLMDAYEDIDQDIETGSYNPFKNIRELPYFDDNCKETLMMQISECCKAFERLPLVMDIGILRNILYSGVWVKFASIYNKRNETGENA